MLTLAGSFGADFLQDGFAEITRTRSRPFFPVFRVGVPYNPLKTKKGTLFIPRVLLGQKEPQI